MERRSATRVTRSTVRGDIFANFVIRPGVIQAWITLV